MDRRGSLHCQHQGVRQYSSDLFARPRLRSDDAPGQAQPSNGRAISMLRAFVVAIAAFVAIAVAVGMGMALPAYADSASSSSSSSSSSSNSSSSADEQVTDNVTDTQNLLGGNISKVTDAITAVKKQTGVTLKLLYLPSFDTTEKPATWAESVLNSTHPVKNTVMLAVASQDGDLVVVVSSNSDSWLRDSSTVNALSDAALGPIVKNPSPDWAQSAIALADKIISIKQQVDAEPVRRFWIIVAIVVGALVVAAAGYVGYLLYRGRRSKPGKHSGAHSA